MLNNDVLFQCNIPSFISDFVSVLAWVDSEGSSYSAGRNTFGNPPVQKLDPLFLGLRSLRLTAQLDNFSLKHNILFSAVVQSYDANVGMEDVLLRNDVLFKCNIPSFISDFVSVVGWVDSEGSSHNAETNSLGKFSASE